MRDIVQHLCESHLFDMDRADRDQRSLRDWIKGFRTARESLESPNILQAMSVNCVLAIHTGPVPSRRNNHVLIYRLGSKGC
jgi:predicted alpha/beta hydrolase family esterase